MTKYVKIEPQPELIDIDGQKIWEYSPPKRRIRIRFTDSPEGVRLMRSAGIAFVDANCTGVVQRDGVWMWKVEEGE